jgi:hypothetical protein
MSTKRGRPSILTEAVQNQLKQAFLVGATDDEACLVVGIAPSTLYKFQEKNPSFSEQKRLWKRSPVFRAKATIIRNLDNVDVAKWYLERRAKDEFSPKQELEGIASTTPIEVIFRRKDIDEVSA